MTEKNTPKSFIPVRTTEKKLETMDIQNGYLYFTIDTNKIYLGMEDGKKLSMGGNTGIFYGKKEIEYPTNGTQPDSKVEFFLDEVEEYSEIEGNRLPQINDLILNIDGCFYRVIDILIKK